MKRPWSEADEARLRDLYGTMPAEAVAKLLQRSAQAVTTKASALGLAKKAPWTTQDDDLLRAMYPSAAMADIAAATGRTTQAVRGRANLLGMKRVDSPDRIERGRRHSQFMRERRAGGYRNSTCLPLWSIRQHGGRWLIKAKETGHASEDWQEVHRFIWEFLNGPIPADHVVVFRDRDNSNLHPDNLELISNAAKMLRHSIARYPREYHRTAVTLGRFKAKLKRLEEAQ